MAEQPKPESKEKDTKQPQSPPQSMGAVHSRQVLEETPERVLKFLSAVSRVPAIRAALETRGYSDADHQEGWAGLHATSGWAPAAPTASIDPVVRDAIVKIDSWDEPNFAIARAALERKHPAQAKYVFTGLEAAQGAGSVFATAIFLERLDTLEHGPDRKATRDEDVKAMQTLAARGIDKEERRRVAGLVAVVKGGTSAPVPVAKDLTAELTALKAWYEEWSTVARNVIKRRDHLIRLGLARRKEPKAEAQPTPAQP